MAQDFSARILRMIKSEIASFIDVSNAQSGDDLRRRSVSELIERIRDALGKSIAEQYSANKRAEIIQAQLTGLMKKAEFAVSEDRDDLAKVALDQKHRLQIELSTITRNAETAADDQEKLEKAIIYLSDDLSAVSPSNPKRVSTKLAELDRLIAQSPSNSKSQ